MCMLAKLITFAGMAFLFNWLPGPCEEHGPVFLECLAPKCPLFSHPGKCSLTFRIQWSTWKILFVAAKKNGVCVCGVTECPVTIFSISQQGDQASSD